MDVAAVCGNLEVLKWLHDNTSAGCTTDAMDIAASDGRLDMVLWFHKNRREGCTSDAMNRAAANGHLEVVKWLYENRSEGSPLTAMCKAARCSQFRDGYKQLRVTQYLYHTCSDHSMAPVVIDALHTKHFDIVLLLHSLHHAFDDEEVKEIRSHVYRAEPHQCGFELRRWFEENYPPQSKT